MSALNMRFGKDTAKSREGTSSVFTSSGKVASLFNWISPTDNNLIYLDGTTAKRRKMSDGTTDSLVTGLTTTEALSCSDLGTNVYFCGFNTGGAGTTQARVYDGLYTLATPNVDKAFAGPLTFSAFTATDGGVGECTRGTHKIGFVFQSRSGFAGKPSPISAGTFAPASITLNANLRIISVSITLDTPADAGNGSAIYAIMTRADNPNIWFFVPDVFAVLPAGTLAWTQVFTISISDEDLANRAESADNQFNFLTQTSGSGPFNPNYVAAYGKRMTYGVLNKVYVSDIDDSQAVTEDLNVIQLPSKRNVAIAFQQSGLYYMLGDRWTGSATDNGDYPSTWAPPARVSDSIGTTAPLGVETQTGGNWAWIAAEPGLYKFEGAYSKFPISYYNDDIWARINWAAAYAIQVTDDVTNRRVHVAVPLDSATAPTHDLVFDYTNGDSYDTVDFSLDTFAASTFASIRAVKEASSARTRIFIGPSAAGRVLKLDDSTENDINPTTGATVARVPYWESGYVRKAGEVASETIRVGGCHLWIRGEGALLHTWKGLDGTPSVTPTVMGAGDVPITTLAEDPGLTYFAKTDLSPVENYTLSFSVNAVDAWLEISAMKPYYKPRLWTR